MTPLFFITTVLLVTFVSSQAREYVVYSKHYNSSYQKPTFIGRWTQKQCSRSSDTECHAGPLYFSNYNCTNYMDSNYYNLEPEIYYLRVTRFKDAQCSVPMDNIELYLADGMCHHNGNFYYTALYDTSSKKVGFNTYCSSSCTNCTSVFETVSIFNCLIITGGLDERKVNLIDEDNWDNRVD